jgi:predicted RNase H-like HicB family nuclease
LRAADAAYPIRMSELVFNVEQEEDGGYSAAAVGQHIYTQGDTWQDLKKNVQEAVEAHFYADASRKPMKIRLHLAHDEEMLVA